ncbi:SIT4-associating protein/190 [Candida albicans P78042]|nr:SIT4-associating protein/190 [Candida albicans P78042]
MSGSFWKFSNGFTSLSNISTLLENYNRDSESGKVEEEGQLEVLKKLLDENDLLQELLSNNPMLMSFLREDKILGMLVNLVILEGAVDEDNPSIKDSKNKIDTKESTSDRKTVEKKSSKSDSKKDKTVDNVKEKGDEKDNEEEDDDEDDDDDDEEKNDEIDEQDLEESAEQKATRRATIAAEILSADVWSLTDAVMASTENLNRLWEILDDKEPLSISLSTYFMKIMEHLLDMKCEDMITYLIENQPNLVEKFVNHLSNPPLMDFLLKLISTDKPDNSTGIIDFLQNQDLITHLVDALDISGGKEEDYEMLLVRQSSTADFLKALITISANSTTDNSTIGPNELTRELVSHEQMKRLCNIMLKGGYALANGVGIIIEIIRKNNSDYDVVPILHIRLENHPPTGRDPIYLGHLLRVFGEKIEEFNKLLIKEDPDCKLRTPFGDIEPLGFERFKICELIAELLHCSNMALLNENRGFDIVKERDELRIKMKEFDPISFKYNETIVLPDDDNNNDNSNNNNNNTASNANDTIDDFNADDSIDEEEPHANANLTEEQLRSSPVVGDFLKIALFDTQIISNILSMFFRFPWNNFLHNVVFDIVQQVLNGSMEIGFNKFLAIDLFASGDITNKIIEGQKLCADYESSHNGLRLGFMGHLTLIAEEVVKFVQLYPSNTLSDLIDIKVESDVWEEYVNNVLYDTREKYNAILGGGDEDDEDDEEDDENTTFEEGLGEIIEEVKTGLVFEEPQKKKDFLDGDESGSDDDDHFSNYMSQQLTNPSTTPNHEHEDELETSSEDDEDEEEYIDPNDDGRSYKKSNSLYDSKGSLKKPENEDEISDESDSSDEEEKQDTKLTRSASKG